MRSAVTGPNLGVANVVALPCLSRVIVPALPRLGEVNHQLDLRVCNNPGSAFVTLGVWMLQMHTGRRL